jgi:hypothetical protein
MRYEIAIALQSGYIVWASPAYRAGRNPDITIFRKPGGLRDKLLASREKTVADLGYRGEPECVDLPNEGSADFQTQMAWARSRHETCNKRIKIFSCMSHRFRHDVRLHQDFFNAVLVLTQLNIQNGDKLFDIEFPGEVEDDELSSDSSSDIDESLDDDSSSCYDSSSSEDVIVGDVLSSSDEDENVQEDDDDEEDSDEDDEENNNKDDSSDDDDEEIYEEEDDEEDNEEDNEEDDEDDNDDDDEEDINDEEEEDEDYDPNYDEDEGDYSMMDDEDADDDSFFSY